MRQNVDVQRAQWEQWPLAGHFKWSELVRWSMNDGLLSAQWVGTVAMQAQPRRLDIEGDEGSWAFSGQGTAVNGRAGGFGLQPDLVQMIQFQGRRFDQALGKGIWSLNLWFRPDRLNIYGRFGSEDGWITASYTQVNGMARLTVSAPRGQGIQLNDQAGSLLELMDRQPDAVRQYLVPAFKMLQISHLLRPGSADVYRLFEQISADPTVMRQVQALLPELDSPDFRRRAATSAKLAELGRAGVLAVLRLDRSRLSNEQRNRLAVLVAANSRRTLGDIGAARHDLRLLTDCLEDEDPAVRLAARQAIEAELGRSIEVDVADEENLSAAVDQLRPMIRQEINVRMLATRPASQPAAP